MDPELDSSISSEPSPSICIGESIPKGRGVFANKDFYPGELIESAPVIIISQNEWNHLEKTELYNYCYAFGETHDQEDMALALGFGSLYNHSYSPNARYKKNIDKRRIDFYALKHIEKGDEIHINYNGDPSCIDPLWFTVLK